jgi:predicted permease
VRLALGAGPWRIVSLLLTENLTLSLLGAALGAVFASWATDALRAAPMPSAFPVRFQTHVDMTGLAFAALLGVASGLAFGAPPALKLARINPQASLRPASQAGSRGLLRDILMGTEAALAVLVLVIAGLFFKSFRETGGETGFRRDGVLLAAYDLTGRGMEGARSREFAERLLHRLRELPGVESAAIASSVPLDIHGMPQRMFSLEGRVPSDGAPDRALTNTVTSGYFETLGIPLRAGTDFVDLADAAAPPQVVVNEEFVQRFIGSGEAIGRRLEAGGRSYTIAGVVRNSLYESFSESPRPIIYFSYRDRPARSGEIHLQTRAGAERQLAPDLRRILRDLDPGLPLFDVRTLGEHVDRNLVFRLIPARMFAVLGPLLLVLAAIGVYGVVAYTVSQRTVEIGVRVAIGATPPSVVRHFVGETLRVIGVGAFAGWAIALVIAFDFLGGSMSPPILLGVPAVLALAATVASWLPARRASRVDAVAALRQG